MIELLNIDCMEYMAKQPDNAFDLAIVDPPYGLDYFSKEKRDQPRFCSDNKQQAWNNKKPTPEYFEQLFRVSEKQIIWGANNFELPPTEYFCIWDKQQSVDNFASAEYAWTNCKMPAKVFRYSIHKTMSDRKSEGGKIHPTQKPVKLYHWLLDNYAEKGQRILDTHLGSGSSAIAAHYFGCDFVGMEIDKDYFKAAKERFDRETKQVAMF